MKKSKIVAHALVVAMAVSTISGINMNSNVSAAAKPKLNAASKTLTVGSSFKLSVKKVTGIKKIVKATWKTSKKKVAVVKSSGKLAAKVTAKSIGSAKITATVKYKLKSGKAATKKLICKVKVANAAATTAPASATPSATVVVASPSVAPTVKPSAAPVQPTAVPATTTPTKTPRPTATPYVLPEDSLKENADFNIGTVISDGKKNSYTDANFTKLAKQQFDIVSFENEMKGYSLLNVGASKDSADGMPVCQFEKADDMVQWAVDNGLKVRGHVLIWESSMATAFFYKNYEETSNDEDLVDADTMLKRMQSYCTQVITHFEEKFPGTVIAWDVVNEAIDAGDKAVKDETTGLYLINTGKFYKILGGDYIKYAFQYAKEGVAAAKKINPDSNILLYYNDYNTFQSPKTDRIIGLIDYLNKDADNKLLDCMGMEGYVLTYWPSPDEVKSAMDRFAKKGLKIGINELTVRLNPDMAEGNDDKTKITDKKIEDHAKKYEGMFKVYRDFNTANPGVLTNVSIWGLTDRPDLLDEMGKADDVRNYDYDVYGTNSGLFSINYREKDVFNRVIKVLQGN